MANDIKFNEDAREALFRGLSKVADAVKETLGPNGRYVAIDRESSTEIINDGVTVAKSIELKDKQEEVGAKLIKEVASKTQDMAGDGTTTATVLAQGIIREGLKYVSSGANPNDIRKGIEKATEEVVEYLRKNSHNIRDKQQIASVASISANNDEEIGNLIADAMEKVGNNGVITVEEASAMETSVETTQGMEINKGYVSPYMVTDSETKEAVFDNPYILVTDHTISSMKDILPILQAAGEESKPLFIIAEDIEGEALGGLVLNMMRGALKVAGIKAPGFGDEKKEQLKDIAALTGARAVIKDEKSELKDISVGDLGTAKRVKVSKDKTTIVEANGSELDSRVSLIKAQLNSAESKSEEESLRKRLAGLTGGVAVLKVGASTETEMKDKKHRVDDALNATRAAVEEGIIAGGGVALLRAGASLDTSSYEGDMKLGADIVKNALEYPFRLILSNGGKDASIVKHKVLEDSTFEYGYNAKSNKYEDLIKAGVVDPLKVTRSGLQHAASISSMILTTQALVVEQEDNKESGGGGMPDMSGLM